MLLSLGTWAQDRSRQRKQQLLQGLDILLLAVSLAGSRWLAEDDALAGQLWPWLELLAVLVAWPVFVGSGLYRGVVRYMGLHTLLVIISAVILYGFVLLAIGKTLWGENFPVRFLLIHGLLLLFLVSMSRALIQRGLFWVSRKRRAGHHQRRAIVYGAGEAGAQLVAALAHSRELLPVALVDDDPGLLGKRIGSLEIFKPSDLGTLIERYQASELLLALPSVPRTRRNEIVASLEYLDIQVRTLPAVAELAEGKVKVADLREAKIEELLGRDPIVPDTVLMKTNIADKVVMVTGAGGSIGSELCRQILLQLPTDLVLFELSEFALYSIERSLLDFARLHGLPSQLRIWTVLGSVTDAQRVDEVIKRFGVNTIYHAAAYKHVPLVEKNPREAVLNNIAGTWEMAHAALRGGVETFVLISTDKAVRPTNVMGTTKRFAELILQALAASTEGATRFTMVRFGNVLGSSGSVVPLFREQIRLGGPVTVTDERVIRYFMTIPEAAQLVIQAGAMGEGGDVFVLDMGEPVKIYDLAQRMIHLCGLTEKTPTCPDGDIEIVITGLRPGEKLYEELLIGGNVVDTMHPRILRANEKMHDYPTISALYGACRDACQNHDSNRLRALLMEAVEEFEPQCENQDVVSGPLGLAP